ncbi:O-antigen ligase family protein [Microbulbifer pacificus]|uniref:O-antigen ligase family protein n=1 Tax=Microbulbifer pacificus TaxID=407164 RepID=UPI000CF3F35F|nr:O-antigen ligase family protein [Microbulbifer pacificus]
MRINIVDFPRNLGFALPFAWFFGLDQLVVVPALMLFFLMVVSRYGWIRLSDPLELCFLAISISCIPSLLVASNYGLWFKFFSAFFSAFCYLYALRVVCERGAERNLTIVGLEKSICYLSAFVVATFFVYLAFGGIEFKTLLFPLANSDSYFLKSLAIHSLGSAFDDFSGVAPQRFSGPFFSYSSMAMAGLLLVPVVQMAKWRIQFKFFTVFLIAIAVISTDSRLAIVSLAFYFLFFLCLCIFEVSQFRRAAWLFSISVAFVFVVIVMLYWPDLAAYVESSIFDVRSASAFTRFKIYEESYFGFLERPWFGWGNSVPLDDSSQRFSAGTHSSYVAMGFQHGIFSLVAYVLFWVIVLGQIARILISPAGTYSLKAKLYSLGMLCFFIRESMDTWWWDQMLFFLVLNYIALFRVFVGGVPKNARTGFSKFQGA